MINTITIHCSASPNGKSFRIADCDSWHKERGFQRNARWMNLYRPELKHVGYQYWIGIDGLVEKGRECEETGAHVAGHNTNNIGICMCGTNKFSKAQWNALTLLVSDLIKAYPITTILGHKEWPDVHKECPGFDVPSWFVDRIPDDKNIL